MTGYQIAAFAGSSRAGSYNQALLRAARSLAPRDVELHTLTLDRLPFYNADVEAAGDPPVVAEFKAAIWKVDGVLIATPEYNNGIPGMLTTAIDWASRFPGRSPLLGKPVAIMGASPSQVGTARAQTHLRQLLSHVQALTLPPPEVLVAQAHERFDADLELTDETTRALLQGFLERFVRWIDRERRDDGAGMPPPLTSARP